jgi:hypothetical protein
MWGGGGEGEEDICLTSSRARFILIRRRECLLV